MDTTTLLRKLAQRGVTLELAGDRLRWQGPKGAMTPALQAALVAHKAEVRQWLGPQRPARRGDLSDGPGGDSASSAGGGICHQAEGVKGQEKAPGDPLPIQDLEALLAELERLDTAGDRTDEQIDALMAKWERLSPPPSGGNGRGECDFDEGGNGAGGDNAGDLVASSCHHTAALERLARERWPDDPPPVIPCGWRGNHLAFWRRPTGGWVCAICHPLPPGLEVERWTLPAGLSMDL